jgi:uncharacterized membrane protein
MNCPHCTQDLTWRILGSRLIDGKSNFLRSHVLRICPFCGSKLILNHHPKERLAIALVAGLLFPLGVLLITDNTVLKWVAFVGFVLLIIVLVYAHLRYFRHWQRYALLRPNERPLDPLG